MPSSWKTETSRYVPRLQALPVRIIEVCSPLRTPALPEAIEHGSLTTLREKLVKMGAKVVRHGRYVTFQLAEIAVPRNLFREILRRIEELRPPPAIPT